MSAADTVRVELGDRGYDIKIGGGVLSHAGADIAAIGTGRVFVVSDENVAALHGDALHRALDKAGLSYETLVLPAGEGTKDFAHLEDLVGALLDKRITREDRLVAFGGGVIGDLVGFAAGIVLRGVDFVQIPTTLLAQVDSSVGGKTGINTRQGKNLAGLFHQPRLVLADTGVLDTLPERELLAGYAEVAKYGLLGDSDFFAWLEANGAAIKAGDRAARTRAIATSCRAKAAIVAEDERETGARALLNLGHTFGHALEAETGYSDTLLHGEAVAIGMVMAFDLSAKLGLCPPGDAARVRRHLADMGLPTSPRMLGNDWNGADLIAHMRHDKKVKDGRIRFILARGIGRAFISDDVDLADVDALLSDCVAA